MSTRREIVRSCLSVRHWTATMQKWPRDWSTPRTYWLTCWTIMRLPNRAYNHKHQTPLKCRLIQPVWDLGPLEDIPHRWQQQWDQEEVMVASSQPHQWTKEPSMSTKAPVDNETPVQLPAKLAKSQLPSTMIAIICSNETDGCAVRMKFEWL